MAKACSRSAAVLVGHGVERNDGVGQTDALTAAERAAGEHFGIDANVARLDHAELELAVVEEKGVAGLDRLENLGVRKIDAAQSADGLAADETQNVAFGELDAAGFEFADAQLGALQIDEDADRAGELGFDLTDDGVSFAQHLRRRMNSY